MIELLRTNSENLHFVELVKHLDKDLAKRDGDDHDFYAQFNKIDKIKHVVVFFEAEKPIGCGAMKEYAPHVMEIKRMYTLPEARGRGVASKILTELENWAMALTYKKCILETGKKQPEAIELYKKNGYQLIPNYGQYAGIADSLCFQKMLSFIKSEV